MSKKLGYLHPVVWAVAGGAIAAFGNALAFRFQLLPVWHPLRNIDVLVTAFAFGLMRFLHSRWRFRIEQQYMTAKNEQQLHDALVILRYSATDVDRDKALRTVIAGLASPKTVGEEFAAQFRQEKKRDG